MTETSRVVRVRKQWRCIMCEKRIQVGELARAVILFPGNDIWDNVTPMHARECRECAERYGRTIEAGPTGGPVSDQEFGVQRMMPPWSMLPPGPTSDVQIYATRAQAEYAADHYNPETYRILVRDVSEWREMPTDFQEEDQ